MRKIKNIMSFIKIDFSFLVLLVLAYFLDELKFYFIYVVFIVLHELAHFLVAKKLGYMPKRIHLSFFGASLEGYDDFLFYDEIKIILAGPLFNFFVAIICYLSFWFEPETYIYFYDILVANLSILLFNILPIFPLDAGRFLLASFSKKYTRTDALKRTKKISFYFILCLFIVFLISFFFKYNFTLGFVCINLVILLFSNSKSTSYKRELFVLKKLKNLKFGLLEKTIYVRSDIENFRLFKFIDNSHYFKFVFLDKNGNKVNEMSEIEFYRKNNLIW